MKWLALKKSFIAHLFFILYMLYKSDQMCTV
jgi:hypothetical protein